MPRASWRGYLRLSLVSCRIYLLPATVRTKPIRLHQVWRAPLGDEAGDQDDHLREEMSPADQRQGFPLRRSRIQPAPARPATRITLRPHDPSTGEEVEKEEVVRGYE